MIARRDAVASAGGGLLAASLALAPGGASPAWALGAGAGAAMALVAWRAWTQEAQAGRRVAMVSSWALLVGAAMAGAAGHAREVAALGLVAVSLATGTRALGLVPTALALVVSPPLGLVAAGLQAWLQADVRAAVAAVALALAAAAWAGLLVAGVAFVALVGVAALLLREPSRSRSLGPGAVFALGGAATLAPAVGIAALFALPAPAWAQRPEGAYALALAGLAAGAAVGLALAGVAVVFSTRSALRVPVAAMLVAIPAAALAGPGALVAGLLPGALLVACGSLAALRMARARPPVPGATPGEGPR